MGHIGQPASLCNSMVLVRARKCCVSLVNRHCRQSFPVQWAEICCKSQQRYTPQIGRIPKRVADSLKCFAIQITILICDAFCHKIHDAGFNAIVDSKLTHLQSIEFCILHFGSFLFFCLVCFFWSNQAPLNLVWVWRSNQEFAWFGFWFDTYKNGSDQAHCHCTVL